MSNELIIRGKIAFFSFNMFDINMLDTNKLLGINQRWVKTKVKIDMPISTYRSIGISINLENNFGNPNFIPFQLPILWLVKTEAKEFIVSPHNFYTSLNDYQVYADISIRYRERKDSYMTLVIL